MRWWCTVVWH